MAIKKVPPRRGRPKALQRDHVLQTALMNYWADGPTNVSVSDICLKTGASKPGVYREFGSDDGLKVAVLELYRDLVLLPLYEILAKDQPFDQALDELIHYAVQDREALAVPDGCLFVAMRARRDELGVGARERLDQLRSECLKNYEDCIDRAKASKDFEFDVPTEIAALYFDAQNSNAMRLQKEGVSNAVISEVLQLAFRVFRQ